MLHVHSLLTPKYVYPVRGNDMNFELKRLLLSVKTQKAHATSSLALGKSGIGRNATTLYIDPAGAAGSPQF